MRDRNRCDVDSMDAIRELPNRSVQIAYKQRAYDAGSQSAADPIDRWSSKPDFQALLYPAIPHDPRLTAETPRAFLACGGSDRPDISQGLPELYLALARLHVSAELHIYAGIGHGFGVRKSNPAPVSGWPLLFLEWLGAQGLLRH